MPATVKVPLCMKPLDSEVFHNGCFLQVVLTLSYFAHARTPRGTAIHLSTDAVYISTDCRCTCRHIYETLDTQLIEVPVTTWVGYARFCCTYKISFSDHPMLIELSILQSTM